MEVEKFFIIMVVLRIKWRLEVVWLCVVCLGIFRDILDFGRRDRRFGMNGL